jgi:hypothetical protein
MLDMTDWRLAAAARRPEIPAPDADRIAPVLEALEAAFAPLAAGIPAAAEPATCFRADQGEET